MISRPSVLLFLLDQLLEREDAPVFQVDGTIERRITKVDSWLQMLVQGLYVYSILMDLMSEYSSNSQSKHAQFNTTCGDWNFGSR
jgi:hypothetical protein